QPVHSMKKIPEFRFCLSFNIPKNNYNQGASHKSHGKMQGKKINSHNIYTLSANHTPFFLTTFPGILLQPPQ
ncbi:hypothetical protein LEC33_27505, partial [Salmonella enterica]|nr:hypothetical protein [Salmonella enterica]MDJ7049714.1 hypothetical protein [Salmonella enterica]MDJ7339222.1 hypothetical protein [Salmonella enterica]